MSAAMVLLEAEVVALLTEGVDRNKTIIFCCGLFQRSPSSRRAWIEIAYT